MATSHVRRRKHRSLRAIGPVVALCAALALFVGSPLGAGANDINNSAGPLTKVTTTPDLNCAINHIGDDAGEFFGDTACGTFVTDGTNLYGPANIPAGGSATNVTGYHAWTPVSQTGPTGSGSASSPFKIVTTVTGGPFTVVQTDTYVIGQESVRTDVKVTSSSGVNAVVYRAGDCYLQGSDAGLGRLDAGVAPTCVADPNSADPNRIEQWYPLTAGSHYMVDYYDSVWAAVGSMQPLPNTILANDDGDTFDNGGGLSWSQALAAGASATFSSITTFSPAGVVPMIVTKTAQPSTVAPGGQVTYTITIANPAGTPQSITQITDMLPGGFGYVTGSTTGATTQDPSLDCLPLTWTGNFTVPAGSDDNPGTLTLSFVAQATSTPGTYTNSATASGAGASVIAATDTAPVTVEAAASTTTTTMAGTTTTVAPTTSGAPTTTTDATTTTTSAPAATTTTTPGSTTTTVPAMADGNVVFPPAVCPTTPTTSNPGGGGGHGGNGNGNGNGNAGHKGGSGSAKPASAVNGNPKFTG